jgi:hypothetical protein
VTASGLRLAARGLRLLLLAAVLPQLRADTVLEFLRGEEPILDSHWGEVYGEASFQTFHEDNLVGMADLKDGFRLARVFGAEILAYGKARAFKDTNDEFWNNKALFGPGLRIKPFEELGLLLFSEYLVGVYYGLEGTTPNPNDSTFYGLEAGAAFWQRWGRVPNRSRFFLPFTGWRELYWDAIYFEFDRDNFIATAQFHEAFGMLRVGFLQTDMYIGAKGAVDSNGDYWNNFGEGVLGVRFRPRSKIYDMHVDVEFVGGGFLARNGDFELPYDREYVGGRIQLSFWFGW